MAKVVIYKVGLYNPATDASLVSRRMATREGVEMMGGWIIEDSAIEIDESQLERGEQWTARGFNPQAATGFQTQVLP